MNRDDAEIAKRLTDKWIDIVRSRVMKTISPSSTQFLAQLKAKARFTLYYRRPDLLEKALNIIPLQRLYDEAEQKVEEGSLEDKVVQRLLHWFKSEFFHWVNNATCIHCTSTETRLQERGIPNQEEQRYDAQIVEVYACLVCTRTTRFARYNNPGKLLETRAGRCGEWANCFTLCCNAIGAEARIVFDTTDHVWTEVYSEYEQRWIHCDACEEAWDAPLMYSIGWNKQLSYCTAFSIYGAIDVTKKYVRDWPTVLKRRTRVHEAALSLFLEDLTNKYQEHLDDSERQLLRDKRMKEFFELEKESQKIIVKDNELTGRISGALDWRLQRGETGNTFSSKMSSFDTNAYQARVISVDHQHQFSLVGSAYLENNAPSLLSQTPLIRLTKAVSDQCGGVYFRQPILIDSTLKGIEVEFAFCVSDGQGGPTMGGADGFAFVLQSEHERALGHGGCQLGYGGIKNSLAVEFDTYQSTDRCADPSNNHISIQARKASQPNSAHHDYSLGHSSRVPLFQSGQWFKSKVRLLTNGVIEIGVAETNVKQDYRQVLKVSNHNFLDYVGTINKSVWLGFTASTGGLSECHDIQWISFTELRVGELIVC